MLSIPYSRYLIYPIPWYSFLIVSGASLAVVLAVREEKRLGLRKDTMIDLALLLLPFGIIGARLYYVLFSLDQFKNDLFSVFRIWEGGLAIYGGIISGLITLFVFCRKRGLPPLTICDIIVPGLALAQCIGRWGNYFNMEAYGFTVSDPQLCFFPLAVQIPSDGYAWHLAAFFYESLWDFMVFLFLILTRKHTRTKEGFLFLTYLFLYGSGRFFIEELRLDSLYASASIRISQLLSVIICSGVVIQFLYRGNKIYKTNSVLILTPVCFLLLSLLISYSLFPGCFIFLLSARKLFFLGICTFLLICCFFAFFFLDFKPEDHYADNKA